MSDAVRRTRPTMKDVADRVGVSIKSVSRVLNGEGGVSPATAEQILAVAYELGFRRNDLARSLRRQGLTETIGVVAKHSSTRFFEGLIRGIEDVAAEHGALVLTATTRTADREHATLLALSSRRVDGLVIMPDRRRPALPARRAGRGLPLVFVDRPPTGFAADAVIADNRGGAHAATAHLLRHGHRRIGLVGPQASLFTVTERVAGYRAALGRGVTGRRRSRSAWTATTSAAAQAATAELLGLPDPPTAIFALSNVCTIGAARALRAASWDTRSPSSASTTSSRQTCWTHP